MEINSVVVGIQYHKGVEALNKGDEVELSFNGADDEFPTGIRVLNNDGVVVGNIIANMNHPSLNDDIIITNNIKNNNAIRKVTTNSCKATVVAIKRYVVFITIHTTILVDNEENDDNGDDNMELKDKITELEAKIEENKQKNRELRKERVAMKRQLKQLKEQLKNNADEVVEETTDVEKEKGETMEEKLVKINKETIIQSVMERNIQPMAIELMQNGLTEAFDKAKEEYPIEVMAYTTKYIDLHPITNILLTIRSIDDIVAKRYLKGEISGGEFDHMRAWIGIHSYFYYEHIIEKVDMEEFFTEASLKASEKFMKEEKEKEYRNNDDEDGGDDTTSSPNIEFVSWTQQSYAWCGSDVTIKVNGKEITLSSPLMSGGSVWFDDDWNEHVEDGPWSIREDALPEELKPYINKITEVINNSIPWGCCGGCV